MPDCILIKASSPTNKDALIGLSYPQMRTARRVRSYDRLWFRGHICSLITSFHIGHDCNVLA